MCADGVGDAPPVLSHASAQVTEHALFIGSVEGEAEAAGAVGLMLPLGALAVLLLALVASWRRKRVASAAMRARLGEPLLAGVGQVA